MTCVYSPLFRPVQVTYEARRYSGVYPILLDKKLS